MEHNRFNAYNIMWLFVFFDCASAESADVHERRVRGFTPDHGQVSILRVTDKQYGGIINIWGAIERPMIDKPMQLELF